ncbi:Protein spinster 3 [Desmophyllum pertusum]|uniref:Protein spinster 3 n=1 Tax=Desmophyllum pertusum TaxID=174260 RepID=A0A9W9ZUD5_9CNID|nr:Protein spinster 3 [Desmophyllum pertusum]
MRTRMLSCFYFAIPVGSGLGYIVGTEVASAFGDKWQWGLRVTPIIGAVCVLLCIFVVHEPKRGAIEKGENPNAVSASNVHHTTSWWADIKYLTTVKSFIWLDLGFTCVTFVTGALAFWAPKFLLYASKAQGITDATVTDISLKVGIITCAAGIVGVWLGAEIAWRYRVRNRKADAIVCAVALLGSAPFLYGSLVLASKNIKITYALIFFGEVLLFMNWAPVGDMVLYIIVPSRRSTAEAVQILFSHLLGDAGSPWLVGEISDRIRGSGDSDKDHARSMEYSLLITTFICVLGGFCFIMCSLYLVKDREEAEDHTRTQEDDSSLLGSVASENYPAMGDENQGIENDDDDDNDDDKLLGSEPVSPTFSDREALVVPVSVHSVPPVQEESNNHVV